MTGNIITEIASECGVSEQAIRAWCRRNHVAKDAKGSFAISESQKNAIYQHYLGAERKQVSRPAKASCETCETSETVLISMLQKELDRKNEQLSVKDKQIEELNARLAEMTATVRAQVESLQASQALHAGTMQQMLPEAAPDETVTEVSAELIQEIAEEPQEENPRKWWQFWK